MSLFYEGPTYGIRDRQQDTQVGVCHKCQGELYAGELVFEVEGDTLCKDCFKEWVLFLLETSPDILALLLGGQAQTVQQEGYHAHL